MTEGPELPPAGGPHAGDPRRTPLGRAGDSREEFALDAGRRGAVEAALDQVFFTLPGAAFDAFQTLLDRPPAPTEGLRRLLLTKAPWE